MNNQCILREADQSDAQAINVLVQASDPHPWNVSMITDALQSRQNWVLECSNTQSLVGWLTATVLFEQSELELIVTDQAWRRRGLAGKLLLHWFAWAKCLGCEDALLEVRASNVGAIKLYEKFGFEEVGIRKNYYPMIEGGFESAILMTHKLI